MQFDCPKTHLQRALRLVLSILLTHLFLSSARASSTCEKVISVETTLHWDMGRAYSAKILWMRVDQFVANAVPIQGSVKASYVQQLMHALYFGVQFLSSKNLEGVPPIEVVLGKEGGPFILKDHHRSKAIYYLYVDGIIPGSEMIPVRVVGTSQHVGAFRKLADLPDSQDEYYDGHFLPQYQGQRPLLQLPVHGYSQDQEAVPLLTPENLPQEYHDRLRR